MKIAIIGPSYPYRGGIALHTNLLFENLSKGHKVDIINFKRLYPDIIFPGKTQFEESENFAHIPSKRLIDSVNPYSWIETANYINSNNNSDWFNNFIEKAFNTYGDKIFNPGENKEKSTNDNKEEKYKQYKEHYDVNNF